MDGPLGGCAGWRCVGGAVEEHPSGWQHSPYHTITALKAVGQQHVHAGTSSLASLTHRPLRVFHLWVCLATCSWGGQCLIPPHIVSASQHLHLDLFLKISASHRGRTPALLLFTFSNAGLVSLSPEQQSCPSGGVLSHLLPENP